MVASLAGCGSNDSSSSESSSASESVASEESSTDTSESSSSEESSAESSAFTFTDSLGREFTFEEPIETVAASGLLSQLVIYSLAPDTLVGWSNEWSEGAEKYIPEKYSSLPLIGQLYGSNTEMNPEQLMIADPDVVIDIGDSKDGIAEDLDALEEQTGIPFIHIDADMATMPECYTILGELLGMEEEAQVYADFCDSIYTRTLDIMEEVGDEKVSVLYLTGDTGTNVIAKGSYHAEIIDLVGDNLAVVDSPSSKGTGNETDIEQLMLWDPEVIFFSPDSGVYDTVADDPLWSGLQAIQSGRYYEVPIGPHNWMGFPPSIQRYLGMMWMTKILYPEQADFDIQAEVTRYYEMFYHYELTDEDYQELVANSLGKLE
ncbi:MAG TPA: ABC transporter substrate-binding protein [Candidatus Faecivivens stercoripullorum]|uniref:ABC transporter substrate-binding protein n=1 Tax=Candidatus Faecivivens stercoripullorum TaxID=2840805 RepID=A0A9D1H7E5_9FIRM|nr:ABC transporter substrate-binding protein [Candidatus Faecivivens stercoripullorum]